MESRAQNLYNALQKAEHGGITMFRGLARSGLWIALALIGVHASSFAAQQPVPSPYIVAVTAGAKGDFAAARDQLYDILESDPLDIRARRALELIEDADSGLVYWDTAALILEGQRLLSEEKWKEAEQKLRKATEDAPEYYQAWHDLGRALAEQGRTREALDAYSKALALNPEYPYTHNAKGLAFSDLGYPERAIAEYHSALGLAPWYYKVYNNLGAALSTLGRESEAQEAFRQALKMRPDYAVAQGNLAASPTPVSPAATDNDLESEDIPSLDEDVSTARLVAFLRSRRSEIRTRAAETLMARHDAAAVPGLVALLDHPRPAVRAVAVRVLGAYPESRLVETLAKVVEDDREWIVRFEAAKSLATIPGDGATDELLRALGDDAAPQVRRVAAYLLGERRSCRVLKALQVALADPAREVRYVAHTVLVEASGQTRPPKGDAWNDWIAAACGAGEQAAR
jgi:tetratricopeptide (TPR) repeat protein